MTPCECHNRHDGKRIVLTGGPGAGKTAVLELVRQSFCTHVRVLPEAASIVFGGGFPRSAESESRRAAQRAIFYVQRELETAAASENLAIVLCDRGTIDGAAYWPGADDLWSSVDTTLDEQLGRYAAVIHLRTPPLAQGYNHQNPLRTESATDAADIDARILKAWERHPRRTIVESTNDFLDKAARVIDLMRRELPDCCKRHVVPALGTRAGAGPSSSQSP